MTFHPLVPQTCYLCSRDDFRIINETDRYGHYYPTGICLHCGNVQQVSYYTPEQLAEFYRSEYRKIYGAMAPADLFRLQRKQGKTIYRFVKDHIGKGSSVLEVGAGAGGILSIFHAHGHSTTGMDYDDLYINYASHRGFFLRQGGLEILGPNETYDLIILSHVLEHIPFPKYFLQRVIGHLSAEGLIYIEVPSLNLVRDDYHEYHHNLVREYWQNAHCIHFTVKTFANLCALCGLQIEKSDSYIRALVRPFGCVHNTLEILQDIEEKKNRMQTRVKESFRMAWLDCRARIIRGLEITRLKDKIKKMIYRG